MTLSETKGVENSIRKEAAKRQSPSPPLHTNRILSRVENSIILNLIIEDLEHHKQGGSQEANILPDSSPNKILSRAENYIILNERIEDLQ